MAAHTVRIDDEACTGHGRCYTLAPTVFEPDDRGQGTVVQHVVDGDDLTAARLAMVNCPESAIHVDPV